MKPVLLDTNVVSALRIPHRQSPAFQRWLRQLDDTDTYICCLTWMEITTGILKKRRTDPAQATLLETWFHSIHREYEQRTIPFDDKAAVATSPLWLLRSRGSVDTLIAGVALANGMALATRNVADFEDVPGLRVINPWG